MKKLIQLNHQEISYLDEGKGGSIIFIHGFCEDHTIWNDFKKSFLSKYRVITPDLPGFGKSLIGKNEVSIDEMAETIKIIADQEQLPRFALIGHSMGGYVTLAFAEKYPKLLSGFGLFHSSCFADDEAKKEARKKVAGFVKRNGSTQFVKELYDTLFSKEFYSQNQKLIDDLANYAAAFPPEGIANASIAMSRRLDRSAVLKQSSVPVLFIVSKNDQVIAFDKSMKMAHLAETSEIVILEHAAHMGMFEEKEKSENAIKKWIARLL